MFFSSTRRNDSRRRRSRSERWRRWRPSGRERRRPKLQDLKERPGSGVLKPSSLQLLSPHWELITFSLFIFTSVPFPPPTPPHRLFSSPPPSLPQSRFLTSEEVNWIGSRRLLEEKSKVALRNGSGDDFFLASLHLKKKKLLPVIEAIYSGQHFLTLRYQKSKGAGF